MVRATKAGQSFALKAFMDSEAPASRFKLETEILANLDNPRIPRYVDAFSQDNVNFLVQEYFRGYPLSYDILQGARFSESEAKKILSQLLTILNYLHQPTPERPAVIHRDLRLSNLFWVEGQLYLVDFGLAEYFSGKSLPLIENTIVEGVRSPRVTSYALLRKEISPRSDLFGAGVVALDLFTNWIEEEASFQKPWQEVLPASSEFIDYLERLVLTKNQFVSANEAQQALSALATV